MGIGIGAKNATVPIYSAEMAPARIRGALVMFWQLWVVAGIFLGFCANVIVKDTGRIAWRLQLGSAFIPSFILGIGIYFCPESPRWLMKHGRFAQGFKSMQILRAHDIIAARDYYYSYVIYVEELKLAGGSTYFSRMWDCFAVPRIRRANYGASTVMLAQQMCGINSKTIEENGALDTLLTYHFSHFILQFDNFRTCAPRLRQGIVRIFGLRCRPGRLHHSYLVLDRHQGPSNFDSDHIPHHGYFPVGCWFSDFDARDCQFRCTPWTSRPVSQNRVFKSYLQIADDPYSFIYLFTIAYSLGEGPVAFQYSAEVFPTIQREQGMAWAVCINNTFGMYYGDNTAYLKLANRSSQLVSSV
jgi:hypothetical protein